LVDFGEQVDALAESLMVSLKSISAGKLTPLPSGGDKRSVAFKSAYVSRAMQLVHLGQRSANQVNSLINAWVLDADFAAPEREVVGMRVLVTKDQLSELQGTLQAILDAGEGPARHDPNELFRQLQFAAALLARDPDNVGRAVEVERFADVGHMGEWLDDLPKRSPLMNITRDDWASLGVSRQREVLDVIQEKILLYQLIHDDTDRWVALGSGRIKGDAVTTIQLDDLP
jgi:serine/threonine-protein kinase PpkA